MVTILAQAQNYLAYTLKQVVGITALPTRVPFNQVDNSIQAMTLAVSLPPTSGGHHLHGKPTLAAPTLQVSTLTP